MSDTTQPSQTRSQGKEDQHLLSLIGTQAVMEWIRVPSTENLSNPPQNGPNSRSCGLWEPLKEPHMKTIHVKLNRAIFRLSIGVLEVYCSSPFSGPVLFGPNT